MPQNQFNGKVFIRLPDFLTIATFQLMRVYLALKGTLNAKVNLAFPPLKKPREIRLCRRSTAQPSGHITEPGQYAESTFNLKEAARDIGTELCRHPLVQSL